MTVIYCKSAILVAAYTTHSIQDTSHTLQKEPPVMYLPTNLLYSDGLNVLPHPTCLLQCRMKICISRNFGLGWDVGPLSHLVQNVGSILIFLGHITILPIMSFAAFWWTAVSRRLSTSSFFVLFECEALFLRLRRGRCRFNLCL